MEKNDTHEGNKPQFKTLVIEDSHYKTILTDKYENRVKWEKPDEKKVYSFLPGTLIKFHVKEGDTVKKGQPLLVFEAMKMMNTIKAAHDGTVKDLVVKPGDKFPKNHLLLELK
ncbi:MAG TPA: acetyl-CoA carboxylase biotin carboxyl carrier protein subunit [Bacteroidales bacterium]|nr:acetyl-CoA carboxylase biotin carboxyl carrier protein subunit [Bacteroidales bacterium]